MKFTLKSGLALLLGTMLFTACETCEPATITPLTEQDHEWLVYTAEVGTDGKPDTIRFSNEKGEPVKYVRTHLYASNVPAAGYSFDDKCIEKMDTQASAVVQEVKRRTPGLATYVIRRNDGLKVQLLVDGLGTYELNESTLKHATKQINGKPYQDVYEINVPGNDKDHKGKLKAIFYNKTAGFIRVEFYGGSLLQL